MIAPRLPALLLLVPLAGCSQSEGSSSPAAGSPAEASAGIQGVVYQAGNGFAEGALVLVLPPGETLASEARARATAGPGGTFSVTGLPAGTWDVVAELGTASGAVLGVGAQAGEVRRIAVELP